MQIHQNVKIEIENKKIVIQIQIQMILYHLYHLYRLLLKMVKGVFNMACVLQSLQNNFKNCTNRLHILAQGCS